MPDDVRMVVFMTRGMALAEWERVGMLGRELALPRRLAAMGADVSLVSYGGPGDGALAGSDGVVRVLENRWRLRPDWYARLAPVLHRRWLRQADMVRSNQIDGAEAALAAARAAGKPFVARCGYLWSDFRARAEGPDSPGAAHARAVEARVFGAAARVVVTTPAMADAVAAMVPAATKRTVVIPNFVDTAAFRPLAVEEEFDVAFVGRLAEQKNVGALLAAVEATGASLVIVGDGPLAGRVEAAGRRLGDRLRWHRRVAHAELPALFAQARLFVLPSLYEGHPKTLIEAMACRRPVIGADSPGIRDEIEHGVTGWLARPDADGIADGIRRLLADELLRRTLGANARARAERLYSLDRIAGLEWDLLAEIAAGARRAAA